MKAQVYKKGVQYERIFKEKPYGFGVVEKD